MTRSATLLGTATVVVATPSLRGATTDLVVRDAAGNSLFGQNADTRLLAAAAVSPSQFPASAATSTYACAMERTC